MSGRSASGTLRSLGLRAYSVSVRNASRADVEAIGEIGHAVGRGTYAFAVIGTSTDGLAMWWSRDADGAWRLVRERPVVAECDQAMSRAMDNVSTCIPMCPVICRSWTILPDDHVRGRWQRTCLRSLIEAVTSTVVGASPSSHADVDQPSGGGLTRRSCGRGRSQLSRGSALGRTHTVRAAPCHSSDDRQMEAPAIVARICRDPPALICRVPRALTLRPRVRAGQLDHAIGGAGWWRCRRPGASRSPRCWCSRTTSPVGERGRGDRARPRRARRAGWAERRLLVVPPDPAHFEVVGPAERAGSSRGDPTVHQDQVESPRTPCSVRCSDISSVVRFSWVEAGTTSAPTGSPVTATAAMSLAPFMRP